MLQLLYNKLIVSLHINLANYITANCCDDDDNEIMCVDLNTGQGMMLTGGKNLEGICNTDLIFVK